MKRISFLATTALVVFSFAGFKSIEAPARQAVTPSGELITYKVDPVHSDLSFKVRHLGVSNVTGTFGGYDASFQIAGQDLNTLKVTATINTNSVDTGVDRRNNHLRSPDFFAVEQYPTMTFVSKAVRNIDGEEFEIVGDLTIKDVTKEVVLKAEYIGAATMGDQQRMGFSAHTKINRMDYHLLFDKSTEAGGFVVGHDVRINLEIEGIRQ